MLFDTHTHIVAPDDERYPRHDLALPNGAWWHRDDCSFESLRDHVGASQADRVVLVQAAGAYRTDNRYLLDSLRDGGDRFVGIVIVDPADPGAPEQLRRLAAAPRVVGVRLFHIPTPADSWLGDERGDAVFDAATELGLAVTVTCQHWDLPALGRQLERRPDAPVVVDHCGLVDFSGGPPDDQAQPLRDLAEHRNQRVQFTPTTASFNEDGANEPRFDADGFELDHPAEMLAAVVDRLGADRVVLGSDWPQHRQTDPDDEPGIGRRLTYAEQLELIIGWTANLSPDQRGAVLAGNATRLFGLRRTN